ncbi:MAG: succinate dehydrogenase, hydrophobic membrane anchor protein [Alphaproteobacteria bacterium]|nr:succinate dehydrogenase, hydrophobic membrane anchor protein [Alphaproteobacteria bacterium]
MASSMRTPLGRVRGHGAAHSGTSHFIAERVTAIALFFLAPWFALSATFAGVASYDAAVAFVRQPVNAVGLILLIAVAFTHMSIGMRVIVEDYIHKPATKTLLLLGNAFLCAALAAAAAFAVLRISLGA